MTDLENKLGYEFKDASLLTHALTHSSYANEKRKNGEICNERLEFLGDAVLGVTVAEYLYRTRSDLPEGQMTRLRAELVCEKALASVADAIGLGEYLRLGHGEEMGGGRTRPSINADAVEAVIAAIYLDGGREQAERFIRTFILTREDEFTASQQDHKTILQERVQRSGVQQIEYNLVEERGPDHSKEFFMNVAVNGKVVGCGSGRSKKQAEQAAAKDALLKMKD